MIQSQNLETTTSKYAQGKAQNVELENGRKIHQREILKLKQISFQVKLQAPTWRKREFISSLSCSRPHGE